MKQNIFTNKFYTHLDTKKYHKDYEERLKNDKWIKQHGFYPFIHFQIKFSKYVLNDKGKKEKKDKIRDIYYSAHIDRFIYQYYGNRLNNCYNKYAKKNGINRVSTAYRNNMQGKCNIDFAKEVFEFIAMKEEAFVFVGDFSKFFDNLEHEYLKKMLCKVCNTNKLSEADFAIYKNITRFSYVEADDIEIYKGKMRKEMRELDKFFTTSEFQDFKKKYLNRNNLTYGIPQGSSISSVYANSYMVEFDRMVNDYATSKDGMYRRYCDDIIMIIPMNKKHFESEKYAQHIDFIDKTYKKIPNLILNMEKTEQFYYSDHSVIKLNEGSSILNYLGFSYDGMNVRLREKSLFKYYCRAYKKVKKVKIQPDSKSRVAAKKALYKSYTHLGSSKYRKGNGNFLTYAYKAKDIFDDSNYLNNEIGNQVRRHWKKLMTG